MRTTFVNRSNSNKKVSERAIEEMNKNVDPFQWQQKWDKKSKFSKIREKEPIVPVSYYIKNKAASLLGHIIRTSNEDPIRQTTFFNDSIKPLFYERNRRGRKRLAWVEETLNHVWRTLRRHMGFQKNKFNINNDSHLFHIELAARAHDF